MCGQEAYPRRVSDTAQSSLSIEQDITGTSLPALLSVTNRNPGPFKRIGFTAENSLKVLYQIKITFKLPDTPIFAPICYNHTFRPSQSDPGWDLEMLWNGIIKKFILKVWDKDIPLCFEAWLAVFKYSMSGENVI